MRAFFFGCSSLALLEIQLKGCWGKALIKLERFFGIRTQILLALARPECTVSCTVTKVCDANSP